MKPDNYREDEFKELIGYFGGYIKLDRPIRFNSSPHHPTIKLYEIDGKKSFYEYGDIRDTIIQRLLWLKYLNEKSKRKKV